MYEKGDLLGRVMEIILPKFQLVCVLNDARVFTHIRPFSHPLSGVHSNRINPFSGVRRKFELSLSREGTTADTTTTCAVLCVSVRL